MTDRSQLLQNAALTLDERLALVNQSRSGASLPLSESQQGLRDFWAQTLGGDEALRRRLGWEDLNETSLPAILDPESSSDPEWLELLRQVLAKWDQDEITSYNPVHEVPFMEVWSAFSRVSINRLRQHLLDGNGRAANLVLLPTAWDDLSDFFARRLAPFGARVFFEDLARYRQEVDPEAKFASTYSNWLRGLKNGGCTELLGRFPVLARALSAVTRDAIAATSEWMDRFSSDWPAICDHFELPHTTCATVARLRLGLSDRHHHGRQAMGIELETGFRLIYKPKSIDLDAALGTLLQTLRESPDGALSFPAAARTLARAGYGWVAWVEQQDFSSASEVGSYYGRCGGLLALVFGLEGLDFTMDNIVATRDGPVAIDAETLLQPLCRPAGSESLTGEALAKVVGRLLLQRDYSVLDTGLLPAWQPSSASSSSFFDVSGLGGQRGYSAAVQQDMWLEAGTTRMRMVSRPVDVKPEHNGVVFKGRLIPPSDYLGEILDGFARAYRMLSQLRDQPDGWLLRMLHSWNRVPVRLLLRSTGIYGRTLLRMLKPEYLRHACLAGVVPESLWKPFLAMESTPAMTSLLREEAAALRRWDIPCFHLHADGDARAPFLISPLKMALRKVSRLSEADLAKQLRIVKTAFTLAPRRPPSEFNRDIAIAEAIGVAGMLEHFESDDLRSNTPTEFPSTHFSDSSFGMEADLEGADAGRHTAAFLYDGCLAGRALFLSALAKITGSSRFRERAEKVLERLWMITGADCDFIAAAPRLPIGAASGLSSFAYTFLTAARLLERPELRQHATDLAGLLSAERIASDSHFDLFCGAAGALMVLASLAETGSADNPCREQALCCGEHLLAAAQTLDGQPGLWWRGQIGEFYVGYGHGAAGIGIAFARLYHLTGTTRFRDAALQVLGALDALFNEPQGRWPALLREGEGPIHRRMESLCHGSAGLGLAAVEAARCGIDAGRIAERALHILVEAPLHEVDTLCCGNIGRIESCLALGAREQAGELALRCLARREPCGLFRTSLKRSEHWTLPASFFRGLSGIGYTLLRTAFPEDIPASACWR